MAAVGPVQQAAQAVLEAAAAIEAPQGQRVLARRQQPCRRLNAPVAVDVARS